MRNFTQLSKYLYLAYLLLELSNQFVVLLEQLLGHFDLELLARWVLNLETMITGIGNIREFQMVLDFAQFATREDNHEDLFVGSQFLDVNLRILGHYGQLLSEGGECAIVIQEQDNLFGFGCNKTKREEVRMKTFTQGNPKWFPYPSRALT